MNEQFYFMHEMSYWFVEIVKVGKWAWNLVNETANQNDANKNSTFSRKAMI